MLSLIVAMSKNQIIGRNGGLPWRLRSDLIRFKKITMGHTLIMGRKTFESIGRVLPGRRTIVVSRTLTSVVGVDTAESLAEALAMSQSDTEPFVVGGGEIYQQALPMADRLYLTRVHAVIDGDTRFPEIDLGRFQLRHQEEFPSSENDEFPHSLEIWERTGWNEPPAR
jgi:dihydrofolate reductase